MTLKLKAVGVCSSDHLQGAGHIAVLQAALFVDTDVTFRESRTYIPGIYTNNSVRFSGHFSRCTWISRFIEAKDDGDGGNNWSCKSCYAPVKSSPPTNLHPTLYRPDALPVAQPTVSRY